MEFNHLTRSLCKTTALHLITARGPIKADAVQRHLEGLSYLPWDIEWALNSLEHDALIGLDDYSGTYYWSPEPGR